MLHQNAAIFGSWCNGIVKPLYQKWRKIMHCFSRFFITLFLLCLAVSTGAEEVEEEKKQLAYISLDPSLITNIKGGAEYIRCDVQLMTKDEANLEDIKLHAPIIRHELLLLLGDQQGTEINTPEGREVLRQKALEVASGVVLEETGKNSVYDLYFTSFFVQ
jgi:flagellar FliL protein